MVGGISVRQFESSVVLLANNTGMEMFADSPGLAVVNRDNSIKVVVSDYRISNKADFEFDAVACYMMVDTCEAANGMGAGDSPMLGVYKVYSVAS